MNYSASDRMLGVYLLPSNKEYIPAVAVEERVHSWTSFSSLLP